MKTLLFTSPVDASNYVADAGTAKGAALRRINYETGEIRFSLIREDDTVAPQVNAITVEAPDEDTAADAIRAAISATIPA